MTFFNAILNLVVLFLLILKNFLLEIKKSGKFKINAPLNIKLQIHKYLDSLPAIVSPDVNILSMGATHLVFDVLMRYLY